MESSNTGIQAINSIETNSDEESSSIAINMARKKETNPFIPKFLIIQRKEEGKSFEKVPAYIIQKLIIGTCSKVSSIKKLQDGSILVQTNTDKQSLLLSEATVLGDFSIKVKPHSTLNSSRGVIKCYDIMMCSLDELRFELKTELVTDVYQVTSKITCNLSPIYILTFNTPVPPDSVKIAYLTCEVKPYIPKPLRCFKCQRFGHSKNACPGKAVCVDCGQQVESHSADSCMSEKKCVNCKGDHSATSLDCPKWKSELAIQQLRAMENISIHEAKKKYFASAST